MKMFSQERVLEATNERSRSYDEILNPRRPLLAWGPDISRLVAISKLLEVMVRSRSRQLKVPEGRACTVRLTQAAQELLDLVYGEGTPLWLPNLAEYPPEVHVDIRSAILFHALRRRGLTSATREQVSHWQSLHPVSFADQVNGVFDQLREIASRREYVRRLEKDRARWRERAMEVHRYLKAVGKSDPDAMTLRLELHWLPQFRRFDYDGVYDEVSRFLANVLPRWECLLVGQAWKIDFNPTDGFYAHLVWVVRACGPEELATLHDFLAGTWLQWSFHRGLLLDCNQSSLALRFRGMCTALPATSLQNQLEVAAIYLAATDAFFYVDAGVHMPSQGHGEPPPVRGWPINAPENIPLLGMVTVPAWRSEVGILAA